MDFNSRKIGFYKLFKRTDFAAAQQAIIGSSWVWKHQYKSKENEELISMLQNLEKSSDNINIIDLPPDVQELVLEHMK